MKKNKVDLLRKMKSDADRFREWRAEQQKEVFVCARARARARAHTHTHTHKTYATYGR